LLIFYGVPINLHTTVGKYEQNLRITLSIFEMAQSFVDLLGALPDPFLEMGTRKISTKN